ncbi:hypothetical protein EOK75_14315 (plasmid) [Pseudorhodobacter turbinis]|uniref:Multidrug resistance protein NorM n=1 Tax=Pseudorhodobacter turbinis TaxID=2500533 RepID=A0A4P8EJ43_9RHOB|nr:hypothetical protein [Pseudorhodobacter turbinis]QCO56969.1 hypothetical protein EOK75_14315 [Pseudorhodobacter turbinis]
MTLIGPWIMVGGTLGMQLAQATGIIVARILARIEDDALLDRFLQSAWRGPFVTAAVVAIVHLGVCLSARFLLADLNPETQSLLLGFLLVLLILPFPNGVNAICGNTLRASGDTYYVMHIFL